MTLVSCVPFDSSYNQTYAWVILRIYTYWEEGILMNAFTSCWENTLTPKHCYWTIKIQQLPLLSRELGERAKLIKLNVLVLIGLYCYKR